jgi:hypothetical protein
LIDVYKQKKQILFGFIWKNILIDNFFNYKTQYEFKEDFNRSFIDHFGIVPNGSIKFFSRYASGFIAYHWLSYTNRKNSSSYNVTIIVKSNAQRSSTAETIFFFQFNNKKFVFFRKLIPGNLKFSSFITTHNQVNQWDNDLDYYYYFVKCSSPSFDIPLCTDTKRKCLLLPFSNDLNVCTEIELELEHD